MFDRLKTFNVATPSGGMHFYFQYEEKLDSIYNLYPEVSVINDQSCVFFGEGYKIDPYHEYPIAKMPQEMFNTLYEQQSKIIYEPIHQHFYDLFSILPFAWFNEKENIMRLVHVMRNEHCETEKAKTTMRQLLMNRTDDFHDKYLVEYFTMHITYRQERFKLATLTKVVKNEYPDRYDRWMERLKIKKTIPKQEPKFEYKEGALTKLSDLKKQCKDINAEKLLNINDKYTIATKHVCKSCSNLHKKGCCDMYNRKNSSTCRFVINLQLK